MEANAAHQGTTVVAEIGFDRRTGACFGLESVIVLGVHARQLDLYVCASSHIDKILLSATNMLLAGALVSIVTTQHPATSIRCGW